MWKLDSSEQLKYVQGQKRTIDILRMIPEEMKQLVKNMRRQRDE